MLRRLIDRFRWWLEPGDVLRVTEEGTLLLPPQPAYRTPAPIMLIPVGMLLVFRGVRLDGLLGPVQWGTTFGGVDVFLYGCDLRYMTRLRCDQVDLT